VGRHAVDLLALLLYLADFLVKHSRAVPESLPSCGALSVVLGVIPPEAAPSLASSSDAPESSC
jgi:hypothetical protein